MNKIISNSENGTYRAPATFFSPIISLISTILLFSLSLDTYAQEARQDSTDKGRSSQAEAPMAREINMSTQAGGTIDYIPMAATSVTPDGKGNLTFVPGVRLQFRYDYNDIDKNNDFYIKRMRIKGKGNIFGIASYNFELKVDNTGKFNQAPVAQLEHAWFTFPVLRNNMSIRVGLEDDVFSRNALTSDSKLLLIDRSMIKEALTGLGVTDNTIGILAYGRPFQGHLSYSAGIFDNLGFNTTNNPNAVERLAKGAMAVGRIAVDLLDPANPNGSYDDYASSYIGEGRRLTIGTNAAQLWNAQMGQDPLSLFAYGADVFFNMGPFTLESEYNLFKENFQESGLNNINGDGWYAQGGFLIPTTSLELAFRYQELDPDKNVVNDAHYWTSIGLNYYIQGHTFKVQAEYILKKEEGTELNNDIFELQLQLSF